MEKSSLPLALRIFLWALIVVGVAWSVAGLGAWSKKTPARGTDQKFDLQLRPSEPGPAGLPEETGLASVIKGPVGLLLGPWVTVPGIVALVADYRRRRKEHRNKRRPSGR